jgi:hypothetical protein
MITDQGEAEAGMGITGSGGIEVRFCLFALNPSFQLLLQCCREAEMEARIQWMKNIKIKIRTKS